MSRIIHCLGGNLLLHKLKLLLSTHTSLHFKFGIIIDLGVYYIFKRKNNHPPVQKTRNLFVSNTSVAPTSTPHKHIVGWIMLSCDSSLKKL